MLVKLFWKISIVYLDLELLYLRKMLHLRKIEVIAFAEKCQNNRFPNLKAFQFLRGVPSEQVCSVFREQIDKSQF